MWQPPEFPKRYRPDIDGLRAIAVLPVLLFHFQVPGFSGGFVGVDVFFVISGYLITSLIWPEVRDRKFSLLRFYERRARRILPALFVVMAVSAAVAYRLFTQADLLDFSRSLAATTAFVSNVHFWAGLDYFAAPAETKPLLHTWSLAIEEQFYILFPLILVALRGYRPERPRSTVALMGLLSFLAGIWLLERSPQSAFYLPHARAWELLLGCLLALGLPIAPAGRILRGMLAPLGLGLILTSVFLFSHSTPFPGFAALLPCLGAALVIWAGEGGDSRVTRLLSWRPLVGIGLISYSLYLWHWPLLVFTQYYLSRPLRPLETAALVAASFLLAALSWKFVESPFRNRSTGPGRVQLFRMATLGAVALVGFGLAGMLSEGFNSRARFEVDESLHARSPACFQAPEAAIRMVQSDSLCRLGSTAGVAPDFLVWGDSHANALFPMIERVASESGATGLFAATGACPPLLGVMRPREAACRDFNDAVLEYLLRSEIRRVILVARWNLALGRPSYELETGDPQVFVQDGQSVLRSLEENGRIYRRGLQRTLTALEESGRQVSIVLQAPHAGVRVPQYLSVRAADRDSGEFRLRLDESIRRHQQTRNLLFDNETLSRVSLLDPVDTLCVRNDCLIAMDGRNLYIDDDHLSAFGAALLRKSFRKLLSPDDRPGLSMVRQVETALAGGPAGNLSPAETPAPRD